MILDFPFRDWLCLFAVPLAMAVAVLFRHDRRFPRTWNEALQ